MERRHLRAKRIEKGYTLEQLASKLSVSFTMLGKVEQGVRNPSVPLAKKWAKCLGIPEKDILKVFFAY
jgi:transcriptional regulator with XRE-family HTH domain